jgi:hypothetical protein
MKLERVAAVWLAALLMVPALLRAQLTAQGNMLTAVTPNMTVAFRNADVVQLTSALTGETYLNPSPSASLLDLSLLNSSNQALAFSAWTVATDDSTNQDVATIVFRDSTRSGAFKVAIDPQTQELVITLNGGAAQPGLRSLSWGVQGVNLSSGRVILPSQGGNYVDARHTPTVSLKYPVSWAAQMVLYEGTRGGFLVYSADPSFQFKDLHLTAAANSTANLQIGTEAPAPWSSAQSIAPSEWRLNVFAGDWRAGAQVYKTRAGATWPSAPTNPNSSWIRNIQAVFAVEVLDAPSFLDILATHVDPNKTLLHLPYWTTSAGGTNYPDYTPSPLLKPFIDHAHSLGFHVDLYFNAIGVDPANRAYGQLRQFQMKTPDTQQPIGWEWDSLAGNPTREAFISPASSAWRQLLLDRVQAVVSAVHPDAVHFDAVPNLVNDGNGLIEGMTSEQGLIQLLQEARTRFPDTVLGTEGMTEASLPYCFTAQSWPAPYMGTLPGHPITTFLQGDQISFHGHLNQPNPGEPGFLQWMQQYETQGVLPLMHADAVYRAAEPSFARLFAQFRQWQAHNFTPYWNGDWNAAVLRYRGTDGAAASLTNDGTLTTLTSSTGVLYQRVHGVSQIRTTRYIDQWPAFDDQVLYGLDPGLEYWLDALTRPSAIAHLTSLPSQVKLGVNSRVSSSVASISLVQIGQPSFDFLAGFPQAAIGSISNSVDAPPCAVCVITLNVDSVGGVIRPTIFEHPPATGAQSFIDFNVPVPLADGIALQFAAGIEDAAYRTDPILFSIAVNGQQLWKESIAKGAWQARTVSLLPWAGQTVHLRLITDAGVAGNAFAWAVWSALQLGANSNPSAPVNVALPANIPIAGFSGNGTLQLSPGSATISNSFGPQNFVLFLAPAPRVSTGESLIPVSFSQYTADPGAIPIAANPTYTRPTIGSASSGSVLKPGVLITSPANNGRSIVAWNVHLPEDKPVQLAFSVGLADGMAAHAPGVVLSVLVNGSPGWSQTRLNSGWIDASVDLSASQGQNVLIELVSDTGTTGSFVESLWSGLQFAPR